MGISEETTENFAWHHENAGDEVWMMVGCRVSTAETKVLLNYNMCLLSSFRQ